MSLVTPSLENPRETYHHGDLAEALIDAAIAAVATGGPEALSLRALARTLGVSPGAPFRHFASKRALLTEVATRATDALSRAVEGALASAPADPLEQLRAFGSAYLDWALSHPTHFRIVSDRRLIAEEGASAIADANNDLRTHLFDILTRAQDAGQVDRAVPVAALALDGRATVYGLARMVIDGHHPEWRADAVAAADVHAAFDRFVARLSRG